MPPTTGTVMLIVFAILAFEGAIVDAFGAKPTDSSSDDASMDGTGSSDDASIDSGSSDDASADTGGSKDTAGLFAYTNTYSITHASNGYFNQNDGHIAGFMPADPSAGGGPWPLFVYMPGTGGTPSFSSLSSSSSSSSSGKKISNLQPYITSKMAKRGYVAVAVEYPDISNIDGSLELKARTVSCMSNKDSALAVLCANDNVNCSAGIAMMGYSQGHSTEGTHIALLNSKFNVHVGAAFMQEGARPTIPGILDICDNVNIAPYLPKNKRRYVLAESDQYYAWQSDASAGYAPSAEAAEANLKLASGYDCGTRSSCLQPSGSGYFVTTNADTVGVGAPDHNNWATLDGVAPWYNTSAAWAFPATLTWIAKAAQKASASTSAATAVHSNCNAAWPAAPHVFSGGGKTSGGKTSGGKTSGGKVAQGCNANTDSSTCTSDTRGCTWYQGWGCFSSKSAN